MDFEFDPGKSERNQLKHGIDFTEAQALWRSQIVSVPAKNVGEQRHLVIGTIGATYWSAIITYRGLVVRIISARRSTTGEIETYEKVAG